MPLKYDANAEWLEADGNGGFASGTVGGARTRRYHALLLHAATPPTGRYVLVNGFDATVETPEGTYPISAQMYAPCVIHPDGASRIESFEPDPWPRWTFLLEDGTRIEQEILSAKGAPITIVRWRLAARRKGVSLTVRPFLSGRDYHALHRENPGFRFDAEPRENGVRWQPYPDLPAIASRFNGIYAHDPHWYHSFLYREEQSRGLDHLEDLASPGTIRFDLSREEAVWILAADTPQTAGILAGAGPKALATRLRSAESRRRARLSSPVLRAADAYLVGRGEGMTIVAGYPWFTDFGRDTFIALRGLCLATGRLDEARKILLEWAGSVSEGMLPNCFPDRGDAPGYNSVDASLWFVVAAHEYLGTMKARRRKVPDSDRAALASAVERILDGYARGTRFGIRADGDGLLTAGEPGLQLTWMDAKVDGWVVTPRIGKAVEVQALWLNALRAAGAFSDRWSGLFERGLESFRSRFWNPEAGCLHDVVDADHAPGLTDSSLRPNQILAVGGLPFSLLEGDQARCVVDAVESHLLTPMGLRSLGPAEPRYAGRCEGSARDRDAAYHQGTVWPWLMGPFVEAWVRVRGGTEEAKREARERFLDPLLRHLAEAGLGHVSEIADGDPPHAPRGCPFQATSLGEVIRIDQVVLAPGEAKRTVRKAAKRAGARPTRAAAR